jgi:hypothetical protein
MDAIVTRMKTIKTSGGYNSNLGTSVYEWRDIENTPFGIDELPALNMKDADVDIYTEVISQWSHYLNVTFEVYCVHTKTIAKEIRKLVEDVLKAVGTDPKFGIATVSYTDFEAVEGGKHMNIKIETNERDIARAIFKLVVLYRTNYWQI